MAPKAEPKISSQQAQAAVGTINPASVNIDTLKALFKDSPQWHQSKRIWFWADEAGNILYSVDEELNHGEGDVSLKTTDDTQNSSSQTVTSPVEQDDDTIITGINED